VIIPSAAPVVNQVLDDPRGNSARKKRRPCRTYASLISQYTRARAARAAGLTCLGRLVSAATADDVADVASF
jgi:hypothetical protein